ncbi:MAG TPA: hypothetical protein VKN76_13925 [Kiloniellaceae bacterium]|nr:hypothetical protein [Kiloniellaceae bacterium]
MQANMEQHSENSQSIVVRSLMAVYFKQREAARRRRAYNESRALSFHTLQDIAVKPSDILSAVYAEPEVGEKHYC